MPRIELVEVGVATIGHPHGEVRTVLPLEGKQGGSVIGAQTLEFGHGGNLTGGRGPTPRLFTPEYVVEALRENLGA